MVEREKAPSNGLLVTPELVEKLGSSSWILNLANQIEVVAGMEDLRPENLVPISFTDVKPGLITLKLAHPDWPENFWELTMAEFLEGRTRKHRQKPNKPLLFPVKPDQHRTPGEDYFVYYDSGEPYKKRLKACLTFFRKIGPEEEPIFIGQPLTADRHFIGPKHAPNHFFPLEENLDIEPASFRQAVSQLQALTGQP